MFCTHCGAQIPDSASFCVGCGAKIGAAGAPPAPAPPQGPGSQTGEFRGPSYRTPVPQAPIPQAPPPPPIIVPSSRTMTRCPWCSAQLDGTSTSCPQCGAALEMPVEIIPSGWEQLPGRHDMAKIQFGDSFCQIEGLYVPVADMNLAASDGVYFSHHVLLWKDTAVNITVMPMRGGWKRMFAGLPLVMTEAHGPGHIAFSHDAPGELIALPMRPGESVDVREHLFLTATTNVAYDWFSTHVWFTTQSGNETETHYPLGAFMDRFSAPQSPGLLLLHAAGNVFIRQLGPEQTILVKPTALVFKDPSVRMHLHFERPSGSYSTFNFFGSSWSNRYFWLRLVGPGRVAIQSVFAHIEGEARSMSNCSYASETQW